MMGEEFFCLCDTKEPKSRTKRNNLQSKLSEAGRFIEIRGSLEDPHTISINAPPLPSPKGETFFCQTDTKEAKSQAPPFRSPPKGRENLLFP